MLAAVTPSHASSRRPLQEHYAGGDLYKRAGIKQEGGEAQRLEEHWVCSKVGPARLLNCTARFEPDAMLFHSLSNACVAFLLPAASC